MAIRSVRIQGMKALADVQLELGQLTLLVGGNGSGKTSVLQALAVVGTLPDAYETNRAWNEELGVAAPYGGLHTCLRNGNTSLRIHVQRSGLGPDRKANARIQLTAEPRKANRSETWVASSTADGVERSVTWFPGSYGADYRNWQGFVSSPWTTTQLSLDADAIRLPSEGSYSDEPTLDPSGANLATVIATWANTKRALLKDVERALQRIVPSVRSVYAAPARAANGSAGWQLGIEFAGVGRVSAAGVSEGTLLTLALLVATHDGRADRDRLVLLDDIDRGLHPRAQLDLMAHLNSLVSNDPRLQIIATTHSPYLVDAVGPENVWALAVDAAGASHAAPLTRALDDDLAAEGLRAGELWATLGEAWILEGGAPDER